MSDSRPPISDSPWFWACLFATAGLVVLWYFSGQYEQRQLRIERQGQAHLRAAEIAAEGEPTTAVSMPGDLRMPLRPIFALLAALLAGGWAMFWWQRFRQARSLVATKHDANSPEKLQKGTP